MTLVMMMAMAISAAAMPYNTARNEALYLSDKMAYELGLTLCSSLRDSIFRARKRLRGKVN